jgi:hypothetical protein
MLATIKCKHRIFFSVQAFKGWRMDQQSIDDVANKGQGRDESKAKGGFARAESLTSEQRKGIARNAALARWDANVPISTHEGSFHIGDKEIVAAVLPNKKRLLTQGTFLKAIGRSRTPKAGTGVMSTVDGTPFFLMAETLKPFIDEHLLQSTTPIFYRTKNKKRAVGYDAELLPMVAEVYLKMRDACLKENKPIPRQYAHIVDACDIVMRGLARVGIIALVDEATGFQETRERHALEMILDQYLRKEFAAWAKKFPDEFYFHIYRLKNWEWKGRKVNPPQVVAHYTKDIVYSRLAPQIIRELERRNPSENGRRRSKHHQWLTDDIGHPALAQHLHAVITLMRVSTTWEQFMGMLNIAHPQKDETMLFSFMTEDFCPASALPSDVPNATVQLSAQSGDVVQVTETAPGPYRP